MKKIAIFGAGGFGREVKMLIDQVNGKNAEWNFVGFFADHFNNSLTDHNFQLGGIEELNNYKEPLCLVLAIGSPEVKRKILSRISNPNIIYPVLYHPGAIMGKENVTVGEGSIICAGNIITVDVAIGKHVILNLSCTVGHDTRIGDFCSFMPGVNISGEVNIEEGVYVGTGAKIINQLEIGQNTVIGAGAVVAKSLPANCLAVGVPAKPIKHY